MVGVSVGDDPLERRPDRFGVALAGALALLAAAATATSLLALPVGFGGALVLVLGTARGSGLAVGLGLAGLLGAVVLAGLFGAGPEALLVGSAAAVLAWDAGAQAVDLGNAMGRAADTSRALVVHTAVSTLVAAVVAVAGYAVFRLAGGTRPVSAVVLLVLGALLIALFLRG